MADSPGTSTMHSSQATGSPAVAASPHEAPLSKGAEWRRALLLAFIGLPITALLFVCAYGFIIWFMQILFWGPPS